MQELQIGGTSVSFKAEVQFMKLTWVVFCIVAFGTSALAQDGITNARDGNGNLIRNSVVNSVKGSGPSPSGAVRSANGPTQPINSRTKGASK
jgi:hypothetical protein